MVINVFIIAKGFNLFACRYVRSDKWISHHHSRTMASFHPHSIYLPVPYAAVNKPQRKPLGYKVKNKLLLKDECKESRLRSFETCYSLDTHKPVKGEEKMYNTLGKETTLRLCFTIAPPRKGCARQRREDSWRELDWTILIYQLFGSVTRVCLAS